MMWLAWRQFRAPAFLLVLGVAVFAVIFGVTAPHLFQVYDTIVKPCAAHGDCGSTKNAFLNNYDFYEHLIQGTILFPVVIGAFLGAPLIAREFEHDTFRLAWTQSETRTRWLVTKLVTVGAGCVIAIGLFSLMATLWSRPWDHVNDVPFSMFDTRDIVPMAYVAFAFALAVAIGAVLRRTLPAMALTLVVYGVARFYFTEKIRSHFMAPIRVVTKYQLPFSSNGNGMVSPISNQADWIITDQTVNKAGVVIGDHGGIGSNGAIDFNVDTHGHGSFGGLGNCPNKFPVAQPRGIKGNVHLNGGPSHAMLEAMQKCVNSFHLREIVTYQPVSRYWTFQWMEFGSFFVLAALLSAFSIWWIRRH
jgi:ABC-type transport system involved in multi-copper enzyme maturation permease subunit